MVTEIRMKDESQTREREMRRMLILDPDLIAAMQNVLPSGNPDRVTQAYGVSWNTWTKLRSRQPIRQSLAQRLLDRIGHDGARITQCVTRIATVSETW